MDNNVKEISPEELLEKINKGKNIQIIDVREVDEWNAGHIAQARLISLHTLPHQLETLDKNVPIVMVCRSGARSHMATEFVSQYGFDAANMVGGMLAWSGEVER